jgi:DNA ligase (NAD+)
MDIRGIGEKLCTALYKAGLVKSVADLYNLTNQQLLTLERMAEKSAAKIIVSINESKDRPLSRVIFALGILHIGEEMARLLANHFGSIDKLADASREELLSISTVGPTLADSIVAFFRQKQNRSLLRKLRWAGVRFEEEAVKPEESSLAGQEFVVTGKLETFTRHEAEAQIKQLGGTTGSNVTRKTTYLVVGAGPGSKLARAQALGIKRLNEEELLRLLRQIS